MLILVGTMYHVALKDMDDIICNIKDHSVNECQEIHFATVV